MIVAEVISINGHRDRSLLDGVVEINTARDVVESIDLVDLLAGMARLFPSLVGIRGPSART